MKQNAINLVRRGADALEKQGDGGSAYALHELANNLLEVMDGRSTVEEWNACYSANGCRPLDLDVRFPHADGEVDGDDGAARTRAARGFREAIRNAHRRTSSGPLYADALRQAGIAPDDVRGSGRHLRKALELVPDDAEHPDDVSVGLTRMADKLSAECERDRSARGWSFKALSAGWLRTAAADVWDVRVDD